MTSKSQSAVALGDIRATSYDAATANTHGYQGTLDDALAQVRIELEPAATYWPLNMSRSRFELLGFLGLNRPTFTMSGQQVFPTASRITQDLLARMSQRVHPEDDSVEYGAPELPVGMSKYSLEHALRNWPENFSAGKL
jgi:hypothetical protein